MNIVNNCPVDSRPIQWYILLYFTKYCKTKYFQVMSSADSENIASKQPVDLDTLTVNFST